MGNNSVANNMSLSFV